MAVFGSCSARLHQWHLPCSCSSDKTLDPLPTLHASPIVTFCHLSKRLWRNAMKHLMGLCTILGTLLLTASLAFAHGGDYSGPGGEGSSGGFSPSGGGTPGPGPRAGRQHLSRRNSARRSHRARRSHPRCTDRSWRKLRRRRSGGSRQRPRHGRYHGWKTKAAVGCERDLGGLVVFQR